MERPDLRVLLVEDDVSLRLLCRVNLELEGFSVLEAGTLAEARVAVPGVDVVLLDLNVGWEDGRVLLRELKQGADGPAVVLLTGSELDADAVALADGLLSKPFAPGELARAVLRAARVESARG
jgi:DNA-binding response OmpR family regulator